MNWKAWLLLFFLALPLAAQTAAPPVAPAYFAGAGLGFSRTEQPQMTGGLIFGLRPANTDNTWMVMKYNNITGETSTVSMNAVQQLAQSGNWSLLAIVGAGGATNDGNLLAMFNGGGGMRYALRGLWSKLEGLSIIGTVEALKITGSEPTVNKVRLQFSAWLTKSF
jgi:hypothetical protein